VLFDIYRPLAYSTLADLVHHVRASLTFPQLTLVVHLSGRNIQDPTLPFSIQIMSAKLLINLLECIPGKYKFDEGFSFFLSISFFNLMVSFLMF
jgi:transformation/transcription domain-associated protein